MWKMKERLQGLLFGNFFCVMSASCFLVSLIVYLQLCPSTFMFLPLSEICTPGMSLLHVFGLFLVAGCFPHKRHRQDRSAGEGGAEFCSWKLLG